MATAEKTDVATKRSNLPAIAGPRLPYHPAIGERFGVDISSWRALVESIFPGAQKTESVILALSYCKARRLDPFKRVVHIVPIWDSKQKCMVDTIWPGIGELRTTAFRTKVYAGRDKTEFGPEITVKVGNVEMTFPEWAQVTVYRMIEGQRVPFSGPQVYWLETYATASRNDDSPNSMWQNRPRGQLDKCAEAAALRAAFPEEIGNEYIPEEVEGRRGVAEVPAGKVIEAKGSASERLAADLGADDPELAPPPEHGEASEGEQADESAGEESQEPQGEQSDASEPSGDELVSLAIKRIMSAKNNREINKICDEVRETLPDRVHELTPACDRRKIELQEGK